MNTQKKMPPLPPEESAKTTKTRREYKDNYGYSNIGSVQDSSAFSKKPGLTGSEKRKHFGDHCRPFAICAALFALTVVGMGAGIGMSVMRLNSMNRYETTDTAVSSYSTGICNITDQKKFFTEDGDLVVLSEINKEDPDRVVTPGYISLQVQSPYNSSYDFVDVPEMSFDTNTVWVSAVFPSFRTVEDSADEVDLIMEDVSIGDSYESIYDYSYLAATDDPSQDAIYKLYRQNFPECFNTITLDYDGLGEHPGVILFTVHSASDEASQMMGSVNLIFRKDGEVVFADTYDYDSGKKDAQFAYTAPINLPEYDSVEVVPLSSY